MTESKMNRFLRTLFDRHPGLVGIEEELLSVYRVISDCFAGGGFLYIAGNGGSAADSEHIVGELAKSFHLPRPVSEDFREDFCDAGAAGRHLADSLQEGLPAFSLTGHPSLSTAIANDISGDLIFAQQVYVYGRPGDVFMGISTSGNSRNVCLAALTASVKGLKVVGLAGPDGGELAGLCETCIRTPGTQVPEIQEYHLCIYHVLCAMLEIRFFSSPNVS